ncbi:MAG: hypothetical protein IPG79_08100 [Saprospiraceae bacterium]|nr:hypothetical protein [Saprospiraceae bacterium]
MMHRKFTLFILLTVVCIFGIPCTSISQRIIKGVVTRYNKPAAEVRIFIEGLKNSPQDTTNENGEFEIFIPAGVKYLSFTEKDDFHSNQLKLSSKDTSILYR